MGRKCSLEGITIEVANIKNILIGNGNKGLVRKVDETRIAIVKLEADSKIKIWVYRGVIGLMIAITSFMATKMYS